MDPFTFIVIAIILYSIFGDKSKKPQRKSGPKKPSPPGRQEEPRAKTLIEVIREAEEEAKAQRAQKRETRSSERVQKRQKTERPQEPRPKKRMVPESSRSEDYDSQEDRRKQQDLRTAPPPRRTPDAGLSDSGAISAISPLREVETPAKAGTSGFKVDRQAAANGIIWHEILSRPLCQRPKKNTSRW